jgi:hypothetical protein
MGHIQVQQSLTRNEYLYIILTSDLRLASSPNPGTRTAARNCINNLHRYMLQGLGEREGWGRVCQMVYIFAYQKIPIWVYFGVPRNGDFW